MLRHTFLRITFLTLFITPCASSEGAENHHLVLPNMSYMVIALLLLMTIYLVLAVTHNYGNNFDGSSYFNCCFDCCKSKGDHENRVPSYNAFHNEREPPAQQDVHYPRRGSTSSQSSGGGVRQVVASAPPASRQVPASRNVVQRCMPPPPPVGNRASPSNNSLSLNFPSPPAGSIGTDEQSCLTTTRPLPAPPNQSAPLAQRVSTAKPSPAQRLTVDVPSLPSSSSTSRSDGHLYESLDHPDHASPGYPNWQPPTQGLATALPFQTTSSGSQHSSIPPGCPVSNTSDSTSTAFTNAPYMQTATTSQRGLNSSSDRTSNHSTTSEDPNIQSDSIQPFRSEPARRLAIPESAPIQESHYTDAEMVTLEYRDTSAPTA